MQSERKEKGNGMNKSNVQPLCAEWLDAKRAANEAAARLKKAAAALARQPDDPGPDDDTGKTPDKNWL